MGVQIGVGRAWIKGTESGNLSGQTYGKQGLYFALNDASVTKTITTANATNPRIDVVYIYVADQQYSGSSNLVDFGVAAGTPTSGASYPANAPTIPANAIALAWVYVAANATNIVNANITNLASSPTVKHVEYFRTAQNDNPAGSMWGNGNYSGLLDAGNSSNYADMVDYPANNQIRFLLPGVYSVTWKAVPNSTVTMWSAIYDGGGSGSVVHGRIPSQSVPASDSVFAIAANLVVVPSAIGTNAAIITMLASIATANTAINWRLKITKVR
jgi:hypothetical protein